MRPRIRSALPRTALAGLACLLAAPVAGAQSARSQEHGGPPPAAQPAPPRAPAGRPEFVATRIDSPPTLDGSLDDDVWRDVPVISDFIQQMPHEGLPATERTEVKIAYDRDNLYVAARCFDTEPDKIVANELRRDISSISTKDDTFAIALDPFHDYRTGLMFIVTPRGSLHDLAITDERVFNWDWDAVWDARTRIDERGWTVEMVIPFRSLRYDPETPHAWSMHLRRGIIRKNEHVFLTRIPAELGVQGIGRLSNSADLVGLDGIVKSHHLELKPFTTGGVSRNFATAPTGAANGSLTGGIDVKYGVTQGLNLDLTYNTDFAQVEADAQQVNLTRFSLFYPEKRDFFLEGRDLYMVGASPDQNANGTLLFFSRRIGLDGGQVIPITGGARVTGRAGRSSLGLLDIRTEGTGATPAANFTVVRYRRDVLQRSSVGAIFTNKTPAGGNSNQAFGVDGSFLLGRSSTAAFFLAKSQTAGTSGGEYAGRAQAVYSVDGWGASAEYFTVGPNFNPEIGYVRRRDIRSTSAGLRYSPRLNKPRVRQIFLTTDMTYLTNTSNVLETRTSTAALEVESQRADKLKIGVIRSFENLDRPFPIHSGVTIPVGGHHFDQADVRLLVGASRRVAGTIEYLAGGFYDGTIRTLKLNSISKPNSHFAYTLNYQRNDVRLPAGAFLTHLVGTELDYTVNARVFTSAFVQWNNDASLAVVNFRLRYIYKLGSDFYVVYNENRQTGSLRPGPLDRSLVVKATYMLRR